MSLTCSQVEKRLVTVLVLVPVLNAPEYLISDLRLLLDSSVNRSSANMASQNNYCQIEEQLSFETYYRDLQGTRCEKVKHLRIPPTNRRVG